MRSLRDGYVWSRKQKDGFLRVRGDGLIDSADFFETGSARRVDQAWMAVEDGWTQGCSRLPRFPMLLIRSRLVCHASELQP